MSTLIGGFDPLNLEFRGQAHVLAAREHEQELCGAGYELVDAPRPAVHAMLIDALEDGGGARRVAQLFVRALPSSTGELHTLARALLEQLELGRVVLLRDTRARSVDLDELEPLPDEDEPSEIVERLDWIEVLIVDEDEQPVRNVRCAITLPDGSKREGRTNSAGILRYDRIPGGSCTVTLLDYDSKRWDKA